IPGGVINKPPFEMGVANFAAIWQLDEYSKSEAPYELCAAPSLLTPHSSLLTDGINFMRQNGEFVFSYQGGSYGFEA
ncbi:hypothetical protein, partial [uncultured Dialister sp.]|uniref:hypothetical protein n=1 Tax=uncultured Dialister sp. TaxID=278064 RepID=UPI0025D1C0D0